MAMRIDELATPFVVIDRTRLTRNIERLQDAADDAGVRLRPHAKTHKSPAIARLQLDRGAIGICCAKIGEAEVFADAGFDDIRLPYPIHPVNARRLLALASRAAISIIVDHADVATGWSDAMRAAGATLDVLIKVDVGYHRCGVDPASDVAMMLVRHVADLPGLRLRGLLSHAGHAYHASSAADVSRIAREERDMLHALAARALGAGVDLEEISVGSTPTAASSLREGGVTELRAGNYVYNDRTQVAIGSAALEHCALSVIATVVSVPARDRLVLDCGSKTLSSDVVRGGTGTEGHGLISPDAERTDWSDTLRLERLSEEHGVVRADAATGLRPGDRVRVLPNHACVVSNLAERVHLVEGSTVVESLPVAARGRVS